MKSAFSSRPVRASWITGLLVRLLLLLDIADMTTHRVERLADNHLLGVLQRLPRLGHHHVGRFTGNNLLVGDDDVLISLS